LAALHEFMEDHHVDIAAITECNVAWSKIDPELGHKNKQDFGGIPPIGLSPITAKTQDAAPYQVGVQV